MSPCNQNKLHSIRGPLLPELNQDSFRYPDIHATKIKVGCFLAVRSAKGVGGSDEMGPALLIVNLLPALPTFLV